MPGFELCPVTDHDVASIGASSFDASAFATGWSLSLRELAWEERRRAKRARRELEEVLASLPAPQFEYELDCDVRDGGGKARGGMSQR